MTDNWNKINVSLFSITATCKKKLDSTTLAAHEDEIYCRHCHKKEFGPKGYGFAAGGSGLAGDFKPTSTAPGPAPASTVEKAAPVNNNTIASGPNSALKAPINLNDPNSCPRCGKKVYFAEEIKALGKKFHRLCFKCGMYINYLSIFKCIF